MINKPIPLCRVFLKTYPGTAGYVGLEIDMYDVVESNAKVCAFNTFSEVCRFVLQKAERALTTGDKMLIASSDSFSFYSEVDGKRYTVKRNGVVKEDLF